MKRKKRRKSKRLLLSVFLVLVLAASGTAFFGWRYLEDFAQAPGPNTAPTDVTIDNGSHAKQIAALLEKSGVISDSQAFYYYVRFLSGEAEQLKAGDYEFAAGMSPVQIIDMLAKGKTKQIRVTIPEGANKHDIAEILERAGFGHKDETLALMNSEETMTKLGAPKVMGGIEGYLFPDTYQFPKRTPVQAILQRMRHRLDEVLVPELKQKIDESGMDLNQVLTLASIVEKETGDPLERPEIAGVFLNRLARKMRLQTDPTVIYSVPNFNGNLTKANLRIDNPYNTYVYEGLPPGPIASPGLAAIKAVLWPTATQNLYFVSRNDGTHEFCPTLKCHEKAVKYWQIEYFRKKKLQQANS